MHRDLNQAQSSLTMPVNSRRNRKIKIYLYSWCISCASTQHLLDFLDLKHYWTI